MEKSSFLNALFLGFGVLVLLAAIFNWNYFFKQRKAKVFVNWFGLTGARIFYALLGLLFSLVGANQLFDLNIFQF